MIPVYQFVFTISLAFCLLGSQNSSPSADLPLLDSTNQITSTDGGSPSDVSIVCQGGADNSFDFLQGLLPQSTTQQGSYHHGNHSNQLKGWEILIFTSTTTCFHPDPATDSSWENAGRDNSAFKVNLQLTWKVPTELQKGTFEMAQHGLGETWLLGDNGDPKVGGPWISLSATYNGPFQSRFYFHDRQERSGSVTIEKLEGLSLGSNYKIILKDVPMHMGNLPTVSQPVDPLYLDMVFEGKLTPYVAPGGAP